MLTIVQLFAWPIKILGRLLQGLFSFLVEHEILEGIIFCFVFGTSISLPFAIFIGLSHVFNEATLVAFVGFVMGGAFALITALITVLPQIGEMHRVRANAADDLAANLRALEKVVSGCIWLLDSVTVGAFEELVGDEGTSIASAPLSSFVATVWPLLELPPTSIHDGLPVRLRRNAKFVGIEITNLKRLLGVLADNLKSWANNRTDQGLRRDIVDRGMQLSRGVASVQAEIKTLQTQCQGY